MKTVHFYCKSRKTFFVGTYVSMDNGLVGIMYNDGKDNFICYRKPEDVIIIERN